MFQPHAHGQPLALDVQPPSGQAPVHIPGRVAGGQDDGLAPEFPLLPAHGIRGHEPLHAAVACEQVGHARLEMHLAPAAQDGQAHVLDDAGQAVGAEVRVRVSEDALPGPVLHEDAQDAVGVPALLAAREELAVAVGARPALAKGVVALGVHLLVDAYARHVPLPFPHVLAPLDDHRVQPQLDEPQGRKEPAGPGPHHQHPPGLAHVPVGDGREEGLLGLPVHVGAHGEVDIHGSLPRVDASPQHPHGLWLDAPVPPQEGDDALLVVGVLGQYSQIKFLCHHVEMPRKVISFPRFPQVPPALCGCRRRARSCRRAGHARVPGGGIPWQNAPWGAQNTCILPAIRENLVTFAVRTKASTTRKTKG